MGGYRGMSGYWNEFGTCILQTTEASFIQVSLKLLIFVQEEKNSQMQIY